jgi:hypothetical protein
VIVGKPLAATFTLPVPTQLLASVTVTEYVVVTANEELKTGLNTFDADKLVPGDHPYVKALLPPVSVVVTVAFVFTHTVGPAAGVIVGLAFTVMVLVPVELQPLAV